MSGSLRFAFSLFAFCAFLSFSREEYSFFAPFAVYAVILSGAQEGFRRWRRQVIDYARIILLISWNWAVEPPMNADGRRYEKRELRIIAIAHRPISCLPNPGFPSTTRWSCLFLFKPHARLPPEFRSCARDIGPRRRDTLAPDTSIIAIILVNCTGLSAPELNARYPHGFREARTSGATSSTYEKSRNWVPSPNTVMGWPSTTSRTKRNILISGRPAARNCAGSSISPSENSRPGCLLRVSRRLSFSSGL